MSRVFAATATAADQSSPPSSPPLRGVPRVPVDRQERSCGRGRRCRVAGGQAARRGRRRGHGVLAQPGVPHREPDTEEAPRRRDVPGGDRVVQRRAQQQQRSAAVRGRRRPSKPQPPPTTTTTKTTPPSARRRVQAKIDHHQRRGRQQHQWRQWRQTLLKTSRSHTPRTDAHDRLIFIDKSIV